MNIQPVDLPSLLRAVIWPVLAVVAIIVFRRPLADLVVILGQRMHKFSFGGISLELAEVSEMKTPQALDAEIRQLEAGMYPQSGVPGLTGLLSQLQHGGKHDYIVIDLGSEASRRWLTSRLYLLALLITLIDRPLCLIFIETVGDVRKKFLGMASPDRVRWALARAYSWLEGAGAAAYAIAGGIFQSVPPAGVQFNPTMNFQLDPTTGFLSESSLSQLVQQFLTLVRVQPPPPPTNTAGPVITALSSIEGAVGSSVTIMGARFGIAGPSSMVAFNGMFAVPTSWSDTQIVVTVPTGAVSGNVVVTANGLVSNGVPFAVSSTDSNDWVLLTNGVAEHAKWLNGSRIEALLGSDLTTSCAVLLPNQRVRDLGDVVLAQQGRFVAVVDPDKTFRSLVDRSTVLEGLASEVSKQARLNKF